jgi:hypothetical protein
VKRRDPNRGTIIDAEFVEDDNKDQEAEDGANGSTGYEARIAVVIARDDDLSSGGGLRGI